MNVQVGAGCGGGCSGGASMTRWRSAPLEEVAEHSPQLALARLWRVQLVPLIYTCTGTFTDPNITTLPTVTWSLNGGTAASSEVTRLSQFAVCDRMEFQIDVPAAFAGDIQKSLNDFFFGLQSPVQATLAVDGSPKYMVAPGFVPIRMVAAMIAEAWPMGWMFSYTQSVRMQFNASFAFPTLPATVTVGFRLWTPDTSSREFVGMTDGRAVDILAKNDIKLREIKFGPGC